MTPRVPTIENIIFGGGGLAGLYEPLSWDAACATVKRAMEIGIRYFDTAPWYGAGRSESIFGAVGIPTEGYTMSTKVGRLIRPRWALTPEDPKVGWGIYGYFKLDGSRPPEVYPLHAYDAASAKQSLVESISRMCGRAVDVARIHDCETADRFAEARDGGCVEALVELRRAGAIREVSLGMSEPEYVHKWLDAVPPGTFDNVMMAGSWNLLDTTGASVLRRATATGVAMHLAGVFAAGALVGGRHVRYEEADASVFAKVLAWEELVRAHGVPLKRVAVQFAFAPSCVTHIALSGRSPEHAEQILDYLGGELVPRALWADAAAKGLLGPEAAGLWA